MKKIITILSVLAVAMGCVKQEKMVIQKFVLPASEEETAAKASYYADLRAYKESDHVLSYVFMGRYATLEGATSLNISYTTMEHRFLSLPDSLDFVNLWMGAPTDKEVSEYCWYSDGELNQGFDYSPQAYADMQYCRKYKGTKFVLHADSSHWGQEFDLIEYDENGNEVYDDEGNLKKKHWKLSKNKQDSHEAYAEFLYRKCLDYDIDGLDFDYEGWGSQQMDWVVNYLYDNKKMGKLAREEGENNLILIVDYWSNVPSGNTISKCDYIVRQAYSVQSGFSSNSALSNSNPDKWILCEQWEQGDPLNFTQGGKKWTDPSKNELGEDLYSMEAYALFCKKGGAKGFGAYYIDNDYKYAVKSKRGTFPTYGYLRNAIRAANPLGGEQNEEE